jgi:diguanylate cyclase (GGDEF)-like protein
LALSLLGDVAGALAAERETLRLVMAEDRQLRELVSDSVNARLDQDRLRRVAMQYADEAYTDPLTGLPNRRRSTEVAAELVQRGVAAMLGVLDLDGFKAVNDTHGHPSGDLVLQRVAGIFARGVRQGDLLSRHGGDEFVVILPKTTAREAREIGSRLCAAVRNEDWSALVPDTPVSASIGWAVLDRDLNAALKEADKDLYRTKRGAKRAA